MANDNVTTPKGFSPWLLALLLVPLLSIPILKRPPTKADTSTIDSKAAPNLQFTDAQGNRKALTDFKGKTVLINFWATWCAPCIEEMPDLIKLEKRLEGKNFILLAVNVEEGNKGQAAKGVGPLPSHLFFDVPDASLSPYGVDSIPVSYLIDKTGIIRRTYLGQRHWDSDEIVKDIETFIE